MDEQAQIQHVSEVFGIRREDVQQAVGEKGVRKATLDFMRAYPGRAYMSGLRKTKSRAMVEAVGAGIAASGNHQVTYNEGSFLFSYRGTPIYYWDAVADKEEPIDAGAFEGTMSTYNQRKEIQQAISAFRDGMGTL